MRQCTTSGSQASVPRARPAFVAGMGHRMAAAALLPRSTLPRQLGAALPAQPDVDRAPPAHALPSPRTSPRSAAADRAAFALACQVAALSATAASGATLLYWQKSGGAAQDREIVQAAQAIAQAHARTALLRTEWASLNEPGRLQELADRSLSLRPVAPAQFVEPSALHAWLLAPASAPPASADPDIQAAPEGTALTDLDHPEPETPPDRPTSDRPAPDRFVSERPAPERPVLDRSGSDRLVLERPPERPVFERPVFERPVPRIRLVADPSPLPLPPPMPASPRLSRPASQPIPPPAPPEPVLRLARVAPPSRFELPHWLTQGRSPRPTVLALSEPPHDLVAPPPPRPVARPVATWSAPPPRPFATVAAFSGDIPYGGVPPGWYPRPAPGWPYGGPAPAYGWSPPYGQAFLPN